ncbi:MAG: prolyl oligopeptidase family serine peptidase [Bryobacteraceae bacterium]
MVPALLLLAASLPDGIAYHAPAGRGPHPVAIILAQDFGETCCARVLAPAGYAVFSINQRLAPEDVERAIRYIRHHAKRWNLDPDRIAIVGGYLSNLVGIRQRGGIPGARDPVDRKSARVQAVVTLAGPSDYRGQPDLIRSFGIAASPEQASPVMHITGREPPFLLIHGDRDEVVPLVQSAHLQAALKAAGVRCDLIIIPGAAHSVSEWHARVPDWELEMTAWLNLVLQHEPPAGSRRR